MNMADAGSPDVNSGGKKILSRRDFLKLAGVGLTLVIKPKLVEIGDNFEKEAVLIGAQQFLIKNEDVPPGVENVPLENEHFMFADEILEKALSQYEEWALRDNLPRPYFRKSESYLDPKDIISGTASTLPKFFDFVKDFFTSDGWTNFRESSRISDDLSIVATSFEQIAREEISSKIEKFGNKPIFFSREDIGFSKDVLYKNPGSLLLKRVAYALEITNDIQLDTADNDKVTQALHNEIDTVWSWVDKYVEKNGSPMPDDVFLAGLIYLNKGDIAGSLWDKAVLKKLAARNNPESYDFNGTVFSKDTSDDLIFLESVRKNTNLFLRRIRDNYSIRLSANWVSKNSLNEELFAYNETGRREQPQYADKNYKPFDPYCAAGIYHGDGIMALSAVTDPEIIQLMVTDENFFLNTIGGSVVGPNPDYGLEKIAADLMVAYRAPEVRKILDKYSV